ncbi:MAG: hypothetical protein H7834_02075 [Magnetococcus sp. YQC-9]
MFRVRIRHSLAAMLVWVWGAGGNPVLAEMTPLETVRNPALSDLLNLAELVEEKSDNGSSEILLYRMPVRDEASEECARKARECRHEKLVIVDYDYSERLQHMETAVFILPEALEWRKPKLTQKIGGESTDNSFVCELRVQEVQNDRPSQDGSLAVVERNLLVRHREVLWQGAPPANATRQMEEITNPEFKDLLGMLELGAEYHLPRVDIRLYKAWQKNSFNECVVPDDPGCPAFRLLIAMRKHDAVWNNINYIVPKAIGGWHVKNIELQRWTGPGDRYRLELEEYYPNPDYDADGERCDAEPARCRLFISRPKVVLLELKKGYFE